MRRLVAVLALAAAACATSDARRLTPREQAAVLMQKGDAKSAVPLLEDLHARSSDDLALARALAEAHVRAGSAPLLLERLHGTDTAVSHYMQGLVLFATSADATTGALAQFERAVELDPLRGELHHRLGLALLESEQYDRALEPLSRALELEPHETSWQLPMAKVLYRSGDTQGAVKALAKVMSGNPTQTDVKVARALMDQIADPFAGFPQAAKGTLEQGIQWLQVADVPQQAIVAFEEILHDHPDLAVVHALLGLAYQRIDDAGRAVDELKRAIELEPKDGKSHLYLGELYLSHQRPKQAQSELEKALELNPLLDDAYARLGDLALDRRDHVTARRHFKALAALAPDSPAARGKLALVHQLEGDWPAADRELHAVVDKDPENVEFILRLGVLHTERFTRAKTPDERQKASQGAARWLQKVLEKQPDNALASRALETVNAR
jgi:tetratricopeptide (TPR) repeat protein